MKVVKRLVSATLALTLLGGSAAVAAPYDHGGNQGYNGGYGNAYRGDNYRGHDGNNSGAIVAGVGILALAAILASQHRHHHYHYGWYNGGGDGSSYNNRYYYGDGGRYGYYNGYNDGDGDQYGNRYGGHYDRNGANDRRW